jgi:hypothetical protein
MHCRQRWPPTRILSTVPIGSPHWQPPPHCRPTFDDTWPTTRSTPRHHQYTVDCSHTDNGRPYCRPHCRPPAIPTILSTAFKNFDQAGFVNTQLRAHGPTFDLCLPTTIVILGNQKPFELVIPPCLRAVQDSSGWSNDGPAGEASMGPELEGYSILSSDLMNFWAPRRGFPPLLLPNSSFHRALGQ